MIGVEAYKVKIAKRAWVFNTKEALKVGAIDGEISVEDIPPLYVLEITQTFNWLP